LNERRRGEFHTPFGRLKNNRQKCFQYFRMGISKFEKFKELLPTQNQKKYTQWRRGMTTEERMTLNHKFSSYSLQSAVFRTIKHRRNQTGTRDHPFSYSVGIERLSLGVRLPGREADHFHLFLRWS
jgi:hypothetical protein